MKSVKEYYNLADCGISNLDRLFNLCPDGIVCKDKNLNYISANKSYCNLFSESDNSFLLGCSVNSCISEKNLKLIHAADTEIKKNKYPINYIINVENGKILNITASPILENEDFNGIISIIRDITAEEKIKENFVNKHFEYINKERSLQAQREIFVASIGHDLKNPTIAQIRGLELLLKGSFGQLNEDQFELIKMILDSCRYMNGMLSSLLETYRNYGGVIKLNFETFSFNELIQECVSEMMYVAKDKGVSIGTVFSNENMEIIADRVQIKRVIMNLLSNGIKYAFKNTEIKLFSIQKNSVMNFYFENKSPYIPREKQKAIFARYVSYASAHKELGIGLGLYASKKIIEAHNGNIYVKSYEDNRNIFGFNIPVEHLSSNYSELVL